MDPTVDAFVPIAQLDPSLDKDSISIRGIVSLVWPYSASRRSFSILLVEPDFRLRRRKGQVRVTFKRSCAKALARVGIANGDEVVLRLANCRWFRPDSSVQTPGKSVDWELGFDRRCHLEIRRRNAEIKIISVDRSQQSPEPLRPFTPPPPLTPVDHASPLSLKSFMTTSSWSTPAFLKQKKRDFSSTLPSSSEYNVFEDDDEIAATAERAPKRVRFGSSQQWRIVGRSPSPKADIDQPSKPRLSPASQAASTFVGEKPSASPRGSGVRSDERHGVVSGSGMPIKFALDGERTHGSRDDVGSEDIRTLNKGSALVQAPPELLRPAPAVLLGDATTEASAEIRPDISFTSSVLSSGRETPSFPPDEHPASQLTFGSGFTETSVPYTSTQSTLYSQSLRWPSQPDETSLSQRKSQRERSTIVPNDLDLRDDEARQRWRQQQQQTEFSLTQESNEPTEVKPDRPSTPSTRSTHNRNDESHRDHVDASPAVIEERRQRYTNDRSDSSILHVVASDLHSQMQNLTSSPDAFLAQTGGSASGLIPSPSAPETPGLTSTFFNFDPYPEFPEGGPNMTLDGTFMEPQGSDFGNMMQIAAPENLLSQVLRVSDPGVLGLPEHHFDGISLVRDFEVSPSTAVNRYQPSAAVLQDETIIDATSIDTETDQEDAISDELMYEDEHFETGGDSQPGYDGPYDQMLSRATMSPGGQQVTSMGNVQSIESVHRMPEVVDLSSGDLTDSDTEPPTERMTSPSPDRSDYAEQVTLSSDAEHEDEDEEPRTDAQTQDDLSSNNPDSQDRPHSIGKVQEPTSITPNEDTVLQSIDAPFIKSHQAEATDSPVDIDPVAPGKDESAEISKTPAHKNDKTTKANAIDETVPLDDQKSVQADDEPSPHILNPETPLIDDHQPVAATPHFPIAEVELKMGNLPDVDRLFTGQKDSVNHQPVSFDFSKPVPVEVRPPSPRRSRRNKDVAQISKTTNNNSANIHAMQIQDVVRALVQEDSDRQDSQQLSGRDTPQEDIEALAGSEVGLVKKPTDRGPRRRKSIQSYVNPSDVPKPLQVLEQSQEGKEQLTGSKRPSVNERIRAWRASGGAIQDSPANTSRRRRPRRSEYEIPLAADTLPQENEQQADKAPVRRSGRTRANEKPSMPDAKEVENVSYNLSERDAMGTRQKPGPSTPKAASSVDAASAQLLAEAAVSPALLTSMPTERGFLTSYTYYAPLSNLHQYVNKQVDCLSIIVALSPPRKAPSGPRDWHMTLYVSDPSMHITTRNSGSTPIRVVQIFRPYKRALPSNAEPGDILLLHSFQCLTRLRRPSLISNATSGWAILSLSKPEPGKGSNLSTSNDSERIEIKIEGPPVEHGKEERAFAARMHDWWVALPDMTRDKLQEQAKAMRDQEREAARRKSGRRNVARPGEVTHELRNGSVYPFTDTPLWRSDDLEEE